MSTPYLSIVACSRNDDHGGHLLPRMQLFIDGLADQAEAFDLDTELVLVEWNPPADREPLAEALRYPSAAGRLTSRVITVPAEVHRSLPHSRELPLFQMIAKNVGIRRARADLVVSTNIDIIFSDALAGFIAERRLRRDALYRADRADISVPFPVAATADVRRVRAIAPARFNRRDGIYDLDGRRILPIYTGPLDIALHQVRRLRERDRRLLWRAPKSSSAASRLSRARELSASVWRTIVHQAPHANAAGDFTLMSREAWARIGGHAEWPMYSWNLDNLLLYQARAHGIREVDLPGVFTVLHMDHAAGSGWSPDGADALFARLRARSVPIFSDHDLLRRIHRMGLLGSGPARPQRLAGDDWGYRGVDFEERSPADAG